MLPFFPLHTMSQMNLKPRLSTFTEDTLLGFQERRPSPVPDFNAAIIAALNDKKGQATQTSVCLFPPILPINLYVAV